MAQQTLLSVENLTVQFRGDAGWVNAVEGVDFAVRAGECLGIVGESGSGKSVSALSILKLHGRANTRYASGTIRYGGHDLLTVSQRRLRQVRGGEIAMIFQDPMSSLNPVLSIADQIMEPLRQHQGLSARAARRRAVELLEMVRISDASRRIDDYPHRLSGGMRQRVMIAIAVACRPKLLIADEPTTALDVTIQSQILELLRELQREIGMSVILITHDLGVVAEFAQRVVVMYAGRVVESAAVPALFERPVHPYTEGLIRAVPDPDADVSRLATIPGNIPDPSTPIAGCRFNPRCSEAVKSCRTEPPALADAGAGHFARCPPRIAAGRTA
ncbi:oligopeptide/dipeptide ABC transporter, ATP-binding protein [Bradyrhizobium sp. YR681]|uniref:ABC transporter ATP-binding protein n=1 Tax=Bradyrhizobium sp. YR681 TaxID=1144344 RepID=UPI00027105D6|nr:ABC transporter ATP-binding protein [Bradyrhizobium sp. YR681]EJN11270.1 oligopeptide/dipeptide ABC transporter, ATP-binding protein [Bradyrhizobium sp. YR681]